MWKQMLPALRMTIALTVLTGLIYPGVVTAFCQALFTARANGSLIARDGKTVGSEWIGQAFARPEYFHGRPSAAGNDGYDAVASSGSNLGPTSQKLVDRVKKSVAEIEGAKRGDIPADLVTTSASGLDPHISPAAARVQIARVAKARAVSADRVNALLSQCIEGRDLGFLGEERVNVLRLNLALDRENPLR